MADVAEKTANGSTAGEIKGKKKNKKSKSDTKVNESEETLEDTAVAEKLNKSHENGNEDESGKASNKSNDVKMPELAEDQSTKKPKEKKKKSKLASQSLDADVPEVKQEAVSSENAEATEDGTDESKKASKKRKRMLPDETEKKSGEEVAIEESKSKKSKCLEESKDVPEANGHAFEQANTDAFEGDLMTVSANSNEMGKSSQKKSASKQPKSSEVCPCLCFYVM